MVKIYYGSHGHTHTQTRKGEETHAHMSTGTCTCATTQLPQIKSWLLLLQRYNTTILATRRAVVYNILHARISYTRM